MHYSFKFVKALPKLLVYAGLGTGALFYHFAAKRFVRRRAEEPREIAGQREVESLTRGERWMHLPTRQPLRVLPMTFAAFGMFTWPALAWRYGILRSTLICLPLAGLQICTAYFGWRVDREVSAYLFMLATPACLCAVALILARWDTALRIKVLQGKGWVSQGRVWVPRGLPLRGEIGRHMAAPRQCTPTQR